MDIDPFKKYGGQQTRSDQTIQDDPFSKYGGSIIKKKETPPVVTPSVSSVGELPSSKYLLGQNEALHSESSLVKQSLISQLPPDVVAKNRADEKNKVNDAIDSTFDVYHAAIKYKTGVNPIKDITGAEAGNDILNFINKPEVQERAKSDPAFKTKLKEAQYNLYNHFPEVTQKHIAEKVGKKLVDDGKAGLFTVPSPKEIDKAASDVLDDHEKYIYDKNLKPRIGTFKEVLKGQTIPTPDIAHIALRAYDKGQGDLYEGARHFMDNLSLGTVSALGESADARQKRILEGEYSTPQVEPKGGVAKTVAGAVDMAAYMVPSIVASLGTGAPAMAAMGAQFYGHNVVDGMKLFEGDKNKQEGYATLTTALDLIAGEKLPIKDAGNAVKSILDDVESGAISKSTGKQRFLDFVTSTAHGTGAVTAMQIGHDAAEKVFEGKSLDPNDEIDKAIKSLPTNAIPMAFFAGVAHAVGHPQEVPQKTEGVNETTEALRKEPSALISEHGEDVKTAQGLDNGVDASKLTEHGKEEAKDIGKQVADNNQTEIVSSDVARAKETAKIAADEVKNVTGEKITPETNPILNTADIGEDDGKPEGTFEEKGWSEGTYLPKGAETFKSFTDRMEKANEYVNSLPETTHVVAHSKVMRALDALKQTDGKWTDETTNKFLESGEQNDFNEFKNHILDHVANVKDNSFDFRITTGLDQKGIEQAVRNIKEGKGTKAAQTLLASIKEMYDDGHVYLNTAAGGRSQSIQIPIKEYMAEVNKPLKVEDLDELNTLLGEDSFNSTFDNAYDYETKRSTEGSQTPTATEGTAGEDIKTPPGGESAPPTSQEASQEITGVKKAVTDRLRQDRGLPKVELPKLASDVDNLQSAKERVDSGQSNPLDMVNRILDEKSGYRNESEVWDMQYYAHQLKAKEEQLRTDLADAKTPEEKNTVSGKILQLSDEIDRQTEAAQTAGNQWHKVGMGMQPVIDSGFNPAREKLFIKEAYGGEIPKEVQAKLDETIKQRDEAIAERNRVQEELNKKMASAGMEGIRKTAARAKRTQIKEELLKEEKDLLEQLRKAIRRDLGNLHSGIPLPKETLETLGKLAVNYFKQGYVTLENLVDKIYSELKDEANISKKDVRDFIGEYQPVVEKLQTQKLTKKAEKLETQIIPPVLKTVRGKLQGISEQPSFAPSKKRQLLFRSNTDWTRANQRIVNAEARIRTLKRQAFESQKNLYEKGLMWAGRLVRLSVLSGKNVLYKLAAAATIGGAGKRIPEQVIGGIYSQIFKGIAKKAPIEGYLNAKSEAKFYKEFFDPKKFVKNSWEILKSGESSLTKKFSTGQYEHVPGLYLPTDLHQVIKDPLKRGTYEASFRNAMIWAEKNGLDVNDPLVINSLETAAYKRANYEIFQEQNWLSQKFQHWKNKMEKSGNVGATGKFLADFMIPVSTVPTNIARRLVTTSPIGLIRGGKQVIDAYRNGIEKLTPDQADRVMKQLKQGSLGTALWLVGWFGYQSFGGLYSKYDPNKKRKEGEMSSDEMEVNGQMIPKPVQHALPLEIIQWAATSRHIYDNYTQRKGDNDFDAILNAGLGSIGALGEQIPIIETGVRTVEAGQDPYQGEKLKEDIKRRFEPQILRETGVIPPPKKKKK